MKTAADMTAVLRLHECPEFKRWLVDMLVGNPNGLGSELVLALPGPDNAARADALLDACERLGWIERTAFAPSDEQLFFGVGGVSGRHLQSAGAETIRAHHGQLWMYRVIDRETVSDYVGYHPPERAEFAVGDRVMYAPAFVHQIQGGRTMAALRGTVVGFSDMQRNGRPCPRVLWDGDGQAHAVGPTAVRKVDRR